MRQGVFWISLFSGLHRGITGSLPGSEQRVSEESGQDGLHCRAEPRSLFATFDSDQGQGNSGLFLGEVSHQQSREQMKP